MYYEHVDEDVMNSHLRGPTTGRAVAEAKEDSDSESVKTDDDESDEDDLQRKSLFEDS